eukprot:GHVS01074109.1.p1 GENE.GHVS01074109.1~~GHVS01074109.1.p1  ORF type:complete len:188 (-),score=18.44 GHVS01074109.1:309-872(-)
MMTHGPRQWMKGTGQYPISCPNACIRICLQAAVDCHDADNVPQSLGATTVSVTDSVTTPAALSSAALVGDPESTDIVATTAALGRNDDHEAPALEGTVSAPDSVATQPAPPSAALVEDLEVRLKSVSAPAGLAIVACNIAFVALTNAISGSDVGIAAYNAILMCRCGVCAGVYERVMSAADDERGAC